MWNGHWFTRKLYEGTNHTALDIKHMLVSKHFYIRMYIPLTLEVWCRLQKKYTYSTLRLQYEHQFFCRSGRTASLIEHMVGLGAYNICTLNLVVGLE